ncbi:MAG: Gfo/Idh/MocA family oxidoreductase [Bacteroidetes bacterium]|nr:Gfo/Idh/MocA family oxidoreductase [Bacteroidota bacterium]
MMKYARRKFLKNATKATLGAGLIASAPVSFASPFIRTNRIGPNDTIRLGMIGTGGRGQNLLELFREMDGADVVACCDIIPFRLEEGLSMAAKGAKGYTDYRKMLEDDSLDAIVISAPLYLHYEMAEACIKAEKHIYCEKTMTFTVEEVKKLGKLLEGYDKAFQVGYQHRYNPLYNKVRDIIKGDEFGELSHIECYWNRNGNWRRPVPDPKWERQINWRMYREYSGGLMAELISHQLNIANWILDTAPESVMGYGGIDYWKDGRETFDNIHAIFQYPKGIKLSATSLTTNAQMGFQMKFYGKNATIQVIRGETYQAYLYVEPAYLQQYDKAREGGVDAVSGASENLKQGKPIALHNEKVSSEDKEPTGKALAEFCRCIRENEAPLVGYDSGSKSAVCVALANKAMLKGEVIKWKDYM